MFKGMNEYRKVFESLSLNKTVELFQKGLEDKEVDGSDQGSEELSNQKEAD